MKKVNLILSLLIIVFAAQISAQQTDSVLTKKLDPAAANYYNLGAQSLKAGEYESAIKMFDSSLAITKDFRTYFLKAQAEMKNGDLDKATNSLNESIKLYPNYEASYFSLAQISLRKGDYDGAIKQYQSIINVTKSDSVKNAAQGFIKDMEQSKQDAKNDSYIKAGDELLKANKNAEAIVEYQKVNTEVANYKIGTIYLKDKKYDDALQYFKKAEEQSKSNDNKKVYEKAMVNLYLARGNEFVNTKKYDKAEADFQNALKIEESDLTHFYLGKVFIERPQLGDALAEFEKAEKLKKTVGDDALAYYKGVYYKNKGDKAKAKEMFGKITNDSKYYKNAAAQLKDMNQKTK